VTLGGALRDDVLTPRSRTGEAVAARSGHHDRVQLENVVWDVRDPHRTGAFWAAALGARVVTDEPDLVEARLELGGGAFLDLCFCRVGGRGDGAGGGDDVARGSRLHLDLRGGAQQAEVVERLTALGATPVDRAEAGRGGVPWVVLADPEGGAFCVMEDRSAYRSGSGPVAALPLDSADPVRDAAFYAAVTGWVPAPELAEEGFAVLRHPAGVGPLLVLCPEPGPKRGKNRIHLDVRRDPDDADDPDDLDDPEDRDDAAVVARLHALGATSLSAPGDLPWLVFADPSGNELCVLSPASSGGAAT